MTRPVQDPFAPPFPALAMVVIALATALLAPLLPLAMAPAFIALAVLGSGLMLWRTRALPPLPVDLVLPLLLFWAYGALSIAWTPEPRSGIAQSVTFAYTLAPGLLLLAGLGALGEAAAGRIGRVALGGFLVGAAIFTVETLFGQPIYTFWKAVEGGVVAAERALNRPSVILALLVWPVALVLARMGRPRLALLPPVLLTLLMPFTPSASTVVGMALGLAAFLVALWRPALVRWSLAALLVLGFLVCALVPGLLAAWDGGPADLLPRSFVHRVEIWAFAADRVAERPWLGWGLDASRALAGAEDVTALSKDLSLLPLHPHNLFLQTRLELGWVGAAALAWFGLALLARVARLPQPAQACALACMATALGIGSFAYGAWQTWWVCSQLLAAFLLVVASRISSGAGSSRPPQP